MPDMMQQQSNITEDTIYSEEGKMPDIQALALRAQGLTQTVDFWNTAMIWAMVFTALAAIAVVVTTHMALHRAKQLAEVQDELIHAKDKQLAFDLKDKDLKIAEANERAAEAMLALAKLKQPRVLTGEQQERIFSKIKSFPGRSFAAYAFADQESINLANTIGHILFRAQWVAQRPDSDIAIGMLGATVLTGVQIEVAPSHANLLKQASEALASALSAEGLPCKVAEVPLREKSPNAIHVVIGKKPT